MTPLIKATESTKMAAWMNMNASWDDCGNGTRASAKTNGISDGRNSGNIVGRNALQIAKPLTRLNASIERRIKNASMNDSVNITRSTKTSSASINNYLTGSIAKLGWLPLERISLRRICVAMNSGVKTRTFKNIVIGWNFIKNIRVLARRIGDTAKISLGNDSRSYFSGRGQVPATSVESQRTVIARDFTLTTRTTTAHIAAFFVRSATAPWASWEII